MPCRSIITLSIFFLMCLLFAFTIIFPANFTSFLLTSSYFLDIGNIFLPFLISSSSGFIVTSDPVSAMICFSVSSFFSNMVSPVGYVFFFRLLFLLTCRYRFPRSLRVP